MCPADKQEPDEDPIEYKIFPDHEEYSESLGGCVSVELVIYMVDNIPEKFREPIISHEVGESILSRQSRPIEEAHSYGIECEMMYAD